MKTNLPGQRKTHDCAMTFEEIAREMGISKQLVWFHYSNAIRKLRRHGRARRLLEIATSREAQP